MYMFVSDIHGPFATKWGHQQQWGKVWVEEAWPCGSSSKDRILQELHSAECSSCFYNYREWMRGFGTDIVDLNSPNMNLNSFSHFGWFTVVDPSNKRRPNSCNNSFWHAYFQAHISNITTQFTWAVRPAAGSSDAALYLRGRVSTSLIASMLTSLGSTANSDVTYIMMDFLSGNWTATSEIQMKTACRVGVRHGLINNGNTPLVKHSQQSRHFINHKKAVCQVVWLWHNPTTTWLDALFSICGERWFGKLISLLFKT